MKIHNLKDQPGCSETLAQWHHGEWSHLNPGISLEDRIEKMQEYFSDEFIPSMFVGKEGEAIVGSAAIIRNDMDVHTDLFPWLANVFVNPAYRNQGIASALVRHVMAVAADAGISRLYLFTPDQEKFYKRLGWRTLFSEEYHNHPVTVMTIDPGSDTALTPT